MTSPAGAFYSTEDADSEGVEGKFYVWDLAEIRAVLGPDRAATFAAVYDVAEGGNWEHRTILNLPEPIAAVAKRLARDRGEPRRGTGREPRQAVRGPRAADPPRQGHEGPHLVERPDARRAGRGLDRPRRARAMPPRPSRAAGFLLGHHADRRRPAAPDLQGRPGQAQRLPRRLRQPDRRPDAAVRGDRRRPLDRGGAGADRRHGRRVRRRRPRAASSTSGRATRP